MEQLNFWFLSNKIFLKQNIYNSYMWLIKSIFVRIMLNLLKYNLNKLYYFILFCFIDSI